MDEWTGLRWVTSLPTYHMPLGSYVPAGELAELKASFKRLADTWRNDYAEHEQMNFACNRCADDMDIWLENT